MLSRYCNHISSNHGLTNGQAEYFWKEPILDCMRSRQERAEELLDILQSREYQVRFCHANLTLKKMRRQTRSKSISTKPTETSTESQTICAKKLKKKYCLGMVLISFVLTVVIVTVATVMALES